MLRVVLADRAMLLKTTLESILKQRHHQQRRSRDRGGDKGGEHTVEDLFSHLPSTLQSNKVLQQLVEEFFPFKYIEETEGPPRSSFDHNGYLSIPEG